MKNTFINVLVLFFSLMVGFIIIENKVYVTTKNGRLFIINFSDGAIDKILKLDREKLQRPVYFDRELFIAKDNSIIRIN